MSGKGRKHYTYNRMAQAGLDMDDLYDPILECTENENYDDIISCDEEHHAGNHHQKAGIHPSSRIAKAPTAVTAPQFEEKSPCSAEGDVAKPARYPQKKKRQLARRPNAAESDISYWLFLHEQQKRTTRPNPFYDEKIEILWSEVWLVHREIVRTVRTPGRWYTLRQRGHKRLDCALSLLRKELEIPITSAGTVPPSQLKFLSKECRGAVVTLHKRDPERNKNSVFHVDSCRRTPALDWKMRQNAVAAAEEGEGKREEQETPTPQPTSNGGNQDSKNVSIVDILSWHGFDMQLESNNDNDGKTSATAVPLDPRKDEKTLSRLRILNHGAFRFERTVWIQSEDYDFPKGGKSLHIPSERRLLALDRHHCYFFQFCPSQPTFRGYKEHGGKDLRAAHFRRTLSSFEDYDLWSDC